MLYVNHLISSNRGHRTQTCGESALNECKAPPPARGLTAAHVGNVVVEMRADDGSAGGAQDERDKSLRDRQRRQLPAPLQDQEILNSETCANF